MIQTAPPSIAECLYMMEAHAMLPNIREHSFVVARAAEEVLSRIADHSDATRLPDKGLIIAGALLHDIAKTQCLKGGCDHAMVGGDICATLGYDEVAEIVREHVRLLEFVEERYQRGVFLAKEIIFYADKRVMHDRIVELPERLEYILERYGGDDLARHALIRKNFKRCQNLEAWICAAAGCDARQLLLDIKTAPYSSEDL